MSRSFVSQPFAAWAERAAELSTMWLRRCAPCWTRSPITRRIGSGCTSSRQGARTSDVTSLSAVETMTLINTLPELLIERVQMERKMAELRTDVGSNPRALNELSAILKR